MVDYYQDGKQNKKGFSKLFAIIIAAVVLLIGGSVAAFVLIESNTPKASYFLSEKNTYDFLTEQVKERFDSELSWHEKGLENPIEDIYEISAQLNMQLSNSQGFVTPEQIINNSTVTVTSQLDRQEKIATAGIKGSFGNISIEDINFYVTSEKMMLGLPFINEILQLNGDDLGKLLHQVDPNAFTGEEKLDFNMLFKGNIIAEEDVKYIEDEYVKWLYDELPEDAFKSSNETVKMESDNIDTEKITFHLTEDQVKAILKDLFTKMADDEHLKEIIVQYAQAQGTGPVVLGENANLDIPNFEEEYDNVMTEAINGLDNFIIPNGLTSTIWVNKDIIVKRDFSIEVGPTEEQLITLYLTGQLENNDSDVSLTYNFGLVDEFGTDHTVSLDGTLSNNDGETNDTITLSFDTIQLIYESNETTDKNKKDFNRKITLHDQTGYTFDLLWTGNAEYDGDQMNSNHELTIAGDGIPENAVVLTINKDSKITDSISLPNGDEIKDIGSLSIEELMTYYETEVTPQLEQWLMGIIGFGF